MRVFVVNGSIGAPGNEITWSTSHTLRDCAMERSTSRSGLGKELETLALLPHVMYMLVILNGIKVGSNGAMPGLSLCSGGDKFSGAGFVRAVALRALDSLWFDGTADEGSSEHRTGWRVNK